MTRRGTGGPMTRAFRAAYRGMRCSTEAAFDWFSGSLLAVYLAMAVSALALTAALSALVLMRM